MAIHVALQSNDRTAGINRLDDTANNGVLLVSGNKTGVGITVKLLDAERDTLLVGIYGENDGFNFVALLEVADRFFAGNGP